MGITNLRIGYQAAKDPSGAVMLRRDHARRLMEDIDGKHRESVLLASDEFELISSFVDFDGTIATIEVPLPQTSAMWRVCRDSDEILDWYLVLVVHDDLDLGKPDAELVRAQFGHFSSLGDAAKQAQTWLTK